MDKLELRHRFGRGFVQSKDLGRVISQYDELVERGSKSSSLMMWNGRRGQWQHFHLGWTAVDIACSDSGMFVLGDDGNFLYADKGGVREETIDRPGDNPIVRGELHGMCLVGERVTAVGSAGQAFQRTGPKRWSRFDEGLDEGVVLRAVHGVDEDELYAVGDAGEIWRAEGGTWRRLQSPTGVNLNHVRVVDEGLAYATGADGALLRGRGADWTVVEHGGPRKALVGIARFDGKIYVSGDEGVFVLGEDDSLTRLQVGHGPTITFRHLGAVDDVLWSFGPRHLFRPEDGEKWIETTPFVSHFDMAESGPVSGPSACGCGGGHSSGGFSCC
jgi:hypothetical protein